MTPNDIEVLLHYHVMGVPHPRVSAPAVVSALSMFCNQGIITRDLSRRGYDLTAKGRVLVNMLCKTPFPVSVSAYLDPRTEEIIGHG